MKIVRAPPKIPHSLRLLGAYRPILSNMLSLWTQRIESTADDGLLLVMNRVLKLR